MMANIFLDTTISAIPLVGDAFDLMFRAMNGITLLSSGVPSVRGSFPAGTPRRDFQLTP
jgi:hypothetical protein